MRFESKLCHLTENKAIVQVNAWLNDQNLGSSLGEGSTVELAEDKAISRLNKRLNIINNDEQNTHYSHDDNSKSQLRVELPIKEKINLNHEPNDWSNELTEIDLEIKRLKWSREDEINFLKSTFGFNNRNKITKYSDILKYLNLLKQKDISNKSMEINLSLNSLLAESDIILRELSWDNSQGREFLLNEFNVSTRKELNKEQLISFVAKLRSIKNQDPTP